MIRRVLVVVLALLSLAGCQSGFTYRSDESLFTALTGGTFTLHRDVVIDPGRTTITFQNGTASQGASEFEPRCELEVRDILDTPQTISAGSYRIGKVIGMTRYVSRPPGATLLAAGGDPVRLADDSSDLWYMHTYRMPLVSGHREEAPVLVCGGAYDYPFYARYPTLQEMRDALGEYATLRLHQDPDSGP